VGEGHGGVLDKTVGPNHILPTGGPLDTGGLWVSKFIKTVTYQRLTRSASARVAPIVARLRDRRNARPQGHGHFATPLSIEMWALAV
jgi:histidinol dehydrogenase